MTIDLNVIAENLYDDLMVRRDELDLDNTDVRVVDGDKIVIHLEGEHSHKLAIKNGVCALYRNGSLVDVYFDCENIYARGVGATAAFILSLCDLLPKTEVMPIE